MVQNLSADCTAHSPSDGPIWGQWWWQETMCRGRWSPRGSIRFQSSPLDHCSTADQRTLAQLGLHPCIFNWHVGIYDAGSIQGFRKAETMTGKEQMPHIKVSGDCFHASKGGGQFFYLHQFTCFQLSQFWGTSTKLPRVQPERRGSPAAQPPEWHFPFSDHPPTPQNVLSFLLEAAWRVYHPLPWQEEVASSPTIEWKL